MDQNSNPSFVIITAAVNLIDNQSEEHFIWGFIHYSAWVSTKGKNADLEYRKLLETYPLYPNGPFYVLHGDTARYLVAMHKQGKYLLVDSQI